jgi:hypothetical protein
MTLEPAAGPRALFRGRINRNIVCVMALKAFISLAVLAAVMPVKAKDPEKRRSTSTTRDP